MAVSSPWISQACIGFNTPLKGRIRENQMIDYGDFQFASAPATGEKWFLQAARTVGLKEVPKEYACIPFSKKRTGANLNKLRVSMVRHPCAWLMSCYDGLKADEISSNRVGVVSEFNRQSFETFVQDFLLCDPGVIERLFDEYQSDTVMRLEDQPWAIVEFLMSLKIERHVAWKVSQCPKPKPKYYKWSHQLFRLVVNAEKVLCERFNYY
jgi:hypothetical protein